MDMATRVLIRDRPSRAIALVTSTYALILRHSQSTTTPTPTASTSTIGAGQAQNQAANGSFRCIVELTPVANVDLHGYQTVSTHSVHGTLGLISVENDVFLGVVGQANRVATVRPGENVMRILNVEFYCLNSADYDHLLHDTINQYPTDTLDEEGYEHGQALGRKDAVLEHPCLALKKLLSGGSFYYSSDFDLTNRLQKRSADAAGFDFDQFDQGYLWNSYMIHPLVDFRSRLSDQERDALDRTRLLTYAIRGFALTTSIPPHISPVRQSRTEPASSLTIISRLSCKRAGTRFNARGIDDDGNVANFVETETIFWSPNGVCFSYVQIRGSIPLFWEQSAGLLPQQQKVVITRSPQASQPAFDKHFEDLEVNYGPVHVVNLLSKEKQSEVELAQAYHAHIQHSSLVQRGGSDEHNFLRETWYDFHAETARGYEAASGIRNFIQDSADGFAYCLMENGDAASDTEKATNASRQQEVILQQQGVFRVNCLDCLDRTNLIQTIISHMALDEFLLPRSERLSAEFIARHGVLWADNGDALSKIYAGTGAMKSSFTRHGKSSIAGVLADARKTATRMYINNFADKGRQTVMDMLLGRLFGQIPVYLYDPINDYVTSELSRRATEYLMTRDIRIWAGTFNLNGRLDGIGADLSPWLCPPLDLAQQNPEIVAVGFQEIVELSPQQIMSTDPGRRMQWEIAVKRTLNEHAAAVGSEKYLLLRGGQLVGASLSIFAKESILIRIKNVEGSLKKTGMSGIAGNKGAVAIRMDIDNTSLCFVTAHLAAGFANYEDRNRDFKTINHGLRFQRNRAIEDHDAVIWMGDFNYRIGLSSERARKLISTGDYETLYENDQLNLQMVAGLTFPHYSEARILFKPTYKYDVNTDEYDTSEKARIPAWCDRILRKGNGLRQNSYDTAPLRFSDHRPVFATFTCSIDIIDEKTKRGLSRQIYNERKAVVGESTANTRAEDTDDEDLIGYDSIEPGLPPASSDRRKWWLDNGLPARSKLQPPTASHIPNPSRPSNPFTPSQQPDWVSSSSNTSSPSLNPSPKPSLQTLPRKLPPPFDPPRSTGLDGTTDLTRFRSGSMASTNSTIVSRKPPPVPAKPHKLGSFSENANTVSPTITDPTTTTTASTSKWRDDLLRARSQTITQNTAYRDTDRPVSRASSVRTTATASSVASRNSSFEFQPPPRRATNSSSHSLSLSQGSGAGAGFASLQQSPRSRSRGSGNARQSGEVGDEVRDRPSLPPRPRNGGGGGGGGGIGNGQAKALIDGDHSDGDPLSGRAVLKPS